MAKVDFACLPAEMFAAETPVFLDDYFLLSVEKWLPRMERVLTHLGIPLESAAIRGDLETLFKAAAEQGITHGRVTFRLKGVRLLYLIDKLDAEGVLPDGVNETYIEDGLDGPTIGALIKSGALNSKGPADELEFRILPCAEGHATRAFNGRRLEPVGHFYNKSQQDQMDKLFPKYRSDHAGIDAQYADPIEIAGCVLCDRLSQIDPGSDDFIFNWGWYRTLINVAGDAQRRLCVFSRDGRLVLRWGDCLDAYPSDSVVVSVGIKRP